jgi:hypothetical protein
MNFIFRHYPSHPWIAEWTFEPRECNTAYRENCPGHFFCTQPTLGQVAPRVDSPEWIIHIPAPQNSRTTLLANGFCAYHEQRKFRCGAEVLTPEPGVLWGRFLNIPAPQLITNANLVHQEGCDWIETDASNALLKITGDVFCLVSKNRVYAEAARTAETYLEKDFEAALGKELTRRAGAVSLFEEMSHHDSLAAICVESMIKALRPAEGSIPLRWSQSSSQESQGLEINELFPLVIAWSLVDPAIAEELLLCALKIQTNAGALPVHFAPHTLYSTMEAPKPLMVKTAEKVWHVREDPVFLKTILPLLRRHLQWLLHHFDPKRRGSYSWKSPSEAIVPELYQSDLATVDLAVLLLTEIEALNRLEQQSLQQTSAMVSFENERIVLEQAIINQFWNEDNTAFSNALLRDLPTPLHGFPERVPLLWEGLPQIQKDSIIDKIRETESLAGLHGALSWKKSSMEDTAFPLLKQFVLLSALQTADPQSTMLSDFSRLTIQGFVEWQTLSLETNGSLPINPAIAAYIMNVQALHKYRYHAQGRISGFFFKVLRKARADRNDIMIVAATLLVLFCVHTYYEMRNAPPQLATLEMQLSQSYAERNAEETASACNSIIHYYPENAARAKLLKANLLMSSDAYGAAAELYQQVRTEFPDSPSAMVSLGLALQLDGHFSEAEPNYAEFCYLFDEIFPDIVRQVREFSYLMQEGFQTPPKWQEIYRYEIMHELE